MRLPTVGPWIQVTGVLTANIEKYLHILQIQSTIFIPTATWKGPVFTLLLVLVNQLRRNVSGGFFDLLLVNFEQKAACSQRSWLTWKLAEKSMLSRVLIIKGCGAMEYVSKVLIIGYKLETAALLYIQNWLKHSYACLIFSVDRKFLWILCIHPFSHEKTNPQPDLTPTAALMNYLLALFFSPSHSRFNTVRQAVQQPLLLYV